MNTPSRKKVNPVVVAGVKVALGLFQLLYVIARIVPAPDRVVFLSRQSNQATADIAALRDELQANHGITRTRVLARKLDSDTDVFYGLHLVRQVWHLAHARRIVLDSYSFLTSNLTLAPGTRVVQMWHAIGSFKRFGWDDIPTDNQRRRQLADVLRMHAGNSVVVASSDRAADNFASAFRIDRDKVAISPLPRVDRIVDGASRADTRASVRSAFGLDDDTKVLLIAPTIHSSMSDDTIDNLTTVGASHNWRVVVSHHPVTHPNPTPFSTAQQLAAADAFVTDKSSMIYEAGLLDIPGFLWAPREVQDELFAESYPTPHELRPLIVETPEDLFAALAESGRHSAASVFARNYVSTDASRSATERLAEIIVSS